MKTPNYDFRDVILDGLDTVITIYHETANALQPAEEPAHA